MHLSLASSTISFVHLTNGFNTFNEISQQTWIKLINFFHNINQVPLRLMNLRYICIESAITSYSDLKFCKSKIPLEKIKLKLTTWPYGYKDMQYNTKHMHTKNIMKNNQNKNSSHISSFITCFFPSLSHSFSFIAFCFHFNLYFCL